VKDSTGRQNIDNLKSEIRFREKLARQHVDGEVVLADYMAKEDHDVVMKERVTTTFTAMKKLQNNGVPLGPFIELGAERGQRSLVLTNDFNAEGFAVDLSFAQLKTLDYWMEFFNKPKPPLRVCCNAYHLPFQSSSLNFAFCYQFLHHFPDPAPVIKEIHRVLAAGFFYFDEEPYKRFSLKLYRRKVNNKPGKLKKYITFLESFIADQYEIEEEHGIIENDDIPLEDWVKFLEIFDEKRVSFRSASLFSSEMGKVSSMKIRLHKILGGVVSGLVKKKQTRDNNKKTAAKDLYDLLGCPVCVLPGQNGGTDRAPLVRRSDCLKCESCGVNYPIVDNVMILLPQNEIKYLYPKFLG